MGMTPAIHRLDQVTNHLANLRSVNPALRRVRASRLPTRVNDLITAHLHRRMAEHPRQQKREDARLTLAALDHARTLPADIPPDLLHVIADACLIPAYEMRQAPSYRPGLSANARLARQLYLVGTFHAQAEGEHLDLPVTYSRWSRLRITLSSVGNRLKTYQ